MEDLFGDKVKEKKASFRARNVSGSRKGDFYETPYSMTRQLLEVEDFGPLISSIYEPAAGNGAIAKVLLQSGFDVIAEDIEMGQDFLASTRRVETIITNPPYSLALEFVLKAKEACSWKFAFLLPLDYLHGQERFERIFHDTDFPLARVYVFTRRPNLESVIREDGKYPTGSLTFAWFVWDRGHQGLPQIGWIDNQEFVLKAGE